MTIPIISFSLWRFCLEISMADGGMRIDFGLPGRIRTGHWGVFYRTWRIGGRAP